MQLSKFDLAQIKRTNQNSRATLRKMDALYAKMEKLKNEYEELARDYKAMESYVTGKWGFYSEQILSGEADEIIARQQAEAAQEAAPVPEAGVPENYEPEEAAVNEAEQEIPNGVAIDPFAE